MAKPTIHFQRGKGYESRCTTESPSLEGLLFGECHCKQSASGLRSYSPKTRVVNIGQMLYPNRPEAGDIRGCSGSRCDHAPQPEVYLHQRRVNQWKGGFHRERTN